MTPLARAAIQEVAELRGLDPEAIIGRRRWRQLVLARIEIAKRLNVVGYSANRIGSILNKDHSTICFYLGTVARQQPAALRWRKPVIKHLNCYCGLCYFPVEQRALRSRPRKPIRRSPQRYVGFDPLEQPMGICHRSYREETIR